MREWFLTSTQLLLYEYTYYTWLLTYRPRLQRVLPTKALQTIITIMLSSSLCKLPSFPINCALEIPVLISQERKQPFDMCKTLLWSRRRKHSRVVVVQPMYSVVYMGDCLISFACLPSRTITVTQQYHQCEDCPSADVRTEFCYACSFSPSYSYRLWCGFVCSASRRPASFGVFVRCNGSWELARSGQGG